MLPRSESAAATIEGNVTGTFHAPALVPLWCKPARREPGRPEPLRTIVIWWESPASCIQRHHYHVWRTVLWHLPLGDHDKRSLAARRGRSRADRSPGGTACHQYSLHAWMAGRAGGSDRHTGPIAAIRAGSSAIRPGLGSDLDNRPRSILGRLSPTAIGRCRVAGGLLRPGGPISGHVRMRARAMMLLAGHPVRPSGAIGQAGAGGGGDMRLAQAARYSGTDRHARA